VILAHFFEAIDVHWARVVGCKLRPIHAALAEIIEQYRGSSPGGSRGDTYETASEIRVIGAGSGLVLVESEEVLRVVLALRESGGLTTRPRASESRPARQLRIAAPSASRSQRS
jgi:hypothetical protein